VTIIRPDHSMPTTISAQTVKTWLNGPEEIAFFDVREAGQFGEGHPFFAMPLPYSRLEADVRDLAPRTGTRVVLIDDDNGLAQLAARRLTEMGYRDVSTVEHGVRGWAAAGYTLFKGVNLPSKTFGELVEHACDTPYVTAAQLATLRAEGRKLVILDGRTVAEHAKTTIPGSVSCPNGELAYRWRDLVDSPDTPIVVNCAGRTRSIIGAQTLRNLGIANPVYALQNGTQGWFLQGLQLERGSSLRYTAAVDAAHLDEARADAQALAQRTGVRVLSADEAQQWLDDRSRTTYLFDVRTPEEFANGSLQGARSAPGGQLLQSTDQFIGVRKGRLILVDDDGVRAPVVASWLYQQGIEAAVLGSGLDVALRVPGSDASTPPAPVVTLLDAEALRAHMQSLPSALLDLRPSMDYRRAHAAGSLWSIRPIVVDTVKRLNQGNRSITLIADQRHVALAAARDLNDAGFDKIYVLENGLKTWRGAGLVVQSDPRYPADAQCIDYLFFVHDRHEGNAQAARQYLDWEQGLVGQCSPDELGVFRLEARHVPAALAGA
jgi:rhodanese-related sulfurtransferase